MSDRTLVVGGASKAAIAWRRNAAKEGRPVTVLVRRPDTPLENETHIQVEDYFAPPPEAWNGVAHIINFAGAPFQPTEAALVRLNVEGPLALAAEARARGVSRFVQISSLSVLGGAQDIDHATPANPKTLYGRTKRDAEDGLRALDTADFRPLIARAPIIYGPQGGGKLSQLVKLWAAARLLPAPSTLQPRSMVHVHNLALAIDLALPGDETLIYPCDPEPFDLSRLRNALRAEGVGAHLVPAPSPLFTLLERAAPGMYESLYGRSLVVSDSRASLPGDALNLDTALRGLIRADLKRTFDA
jgi:nucleoside-diphosphate-sugar epimerase